MNCENCHEELLEEDINTSFEDKGHGDVKEEVVIGYKCSHCGHIS